MASGSVSEAGKPLNVRPLLCHCLPHHPLRHLRWRFIIEWLRRRPLNVSHK